MEAFSYVMNRVHNRPITHPLDSARQRELCQWVGVAVLLAVVVLFLAWQHVQLRWHGYRLDRLQQERAVEEQIHRKLLLEIDVLQAPARVEALATRHLKLVAPAGEDSIVVERVVPPDAPPAAVVASRRP